MVGVVLVNLQGCLIMEKVRSFFMVFFGLAEEMVGAGVCSTEITYDF